MQKTFTVLICGDCEGVSSPCWLLKALVHCKSEKGSVSKKMKTFSESQADRDKYLDDKVKRQVSLLLNIKKGHIRDEFLIFLREFYLAPCNKTSETRTKEEA